MLDPLIQKMLDGLAALPQPDPATLTAQTARDAMAAMQIPLPKAPMAAVRDVTFPVANAAIKARLYTPTETPVLPCLIYFHGGGWVVGDIEIYDSLARALAKSSGCAVLSVEYRLAPEHKFPVPLNDCYAAVQWAHASAEMLGIDPARIAVGGDSAGGNLAACVALKTRDEGGAPLKHQLLIYPVTDSDLKSRSQLELAEGYFLTRAMMAWYWDQYCRSDADKLNPLSSPSKAMSLARLPNASVVTAAYDPLRDEGDAFARALEEAGVSVSHLSVGGMVHGYVSLIGIIPQAQSTIDFMCAAMVRDFK
jgi:acetyl esterase